MKKYLMITITVFLLFSLSVTSFGLEKNNSIGVVPEISSAPIIDGKLDSVMSSEALKVAVPYQDTDFIEYSTCGETVDTVAYIGYMGSTSTIYITVCATYSTPLEPYNAYKNKWHQEDCEVFFDWYNDSDLGDTKIGKNNAVIVEDWTQCALDIAGHNMGTYCQNGTAGIDMDNDTAKHFNGAVTYDEETWCSAVYEFEVYAPFYLEEGQHIGFNIALQDLINGGANFAWYAYAQNLKIGNYPYFEIGAARVVDSGERVIKTDHGTVSKATVNPTTSDIVLASSAVALVIACAVIAVISRKKNK